MAPHAKLHVEAQLKCPPDPTNTTKRNHKRMGSSPPDPQIPNATQANGFKNHRHTIPIQYRTMDDVTLQLLQVGWLHRQRWLGGRARLG